MPISLRAEREFAQDYPVPQASVADSLLTLWNYPVAKSDLAPEHQDALEAFINIPFLAGGTGRGTLYALNVKGHASDTGDESANVSLSRDRAENVASFLRGKNFPSGANFPTEKITVEWVGSTEPDDPGSSGLSAAHNRRVDVLKITIPSDPTPPPTPTSPGPAFKYKPTFKSTPTFKVPAPTLSTGSIEVKVPFKFPPLRTAEFTIGGGGEAILKLKASDGGDGVGGGIIVDADGKLAAKLNAEIIEHVNSKITVEPSEDGPGVKFKLGAELSAVPAKPEIGYSVTEAVIYISFTFAEQPLADFEAGGVHFTGTIVIKGKVEAGPGPAVLLRAGAVAADAVVVLSPVIVAGLILELEIVAVDAAESRQMEFARLIAIREGIAARVAYVLTDKTLQDQYDARRLEWRNTKSGLVADFIAGADEVDQLTYKPEDLKDRSDFWKKKYAADNNQDFTTLRGRVFDGVGKYDTEGSLDDAVSMLNAE